MVVDFSLCAKQISPLCQEQRRPFDFCHSYSTKRIALKRNALTKPELLTFANPRQLYASTDTVLDYEQCKDGLLIKSGISSLPSAAGFWVFPASTGNFQNATLVLSAGIPLCALVIQCMIPQYISELLNRVLFTRAEKLSRSYSELPDFDNPFSVMSLTFIFIFCTR